jgi:hypothetical protein
MEEFARHVVVASGDVGMVVAEQASENLQRLFVEPTFRTSRADSSPII